MRRMAAWAIVIGLTAAGRAALAAPPLDPQTTALALAQAAFAPGSSAAVEFDPIERLLDQQLYARDEGLLRQGDNGALKPALGGPIDLVRLGLSRRAGFLAPRPGQAGFDPGAYEMNVRSWRGLSFGAGDLAVDVSPHAGLGGSTFGGAAEAGATLRLSQRLSDRLKSLGVRDGADFGDRGRWYLFAAASGRAVGLNLLHQADGWDRAGWSTDPTSKLIGDAQIGVGWRKGPLQTSLGFVHRQVKGQHTLPGVDSRDDSMMAFSLSIKPRR